jgi:PAS domain S-box-containing protein
VNAPRLLPRGSPDTPTRVGVLARMRVGTKLMLLVLLPVCSLLVFASIATVGDWRAARRLRDFRADARLSFGTAAALTAVQDERRATALERLGVRSDGRQIAALQRATDAALRRAVPPTPGRRSGVDAAARLRVARRHLDALRRQAAAGSVGVQQIIEDYGRIDRELYGIVRDLDDARPTQATNEATIAYAGLVQAIEGADLERVTQAAAFRNGTASVRVRGTLVEAGTLDDFRGYAGRPLVAGLDRVLAGPASATVNRVRELMVQDPESLSRRFSLGQWLGASGRRIDGLRRLERRSAAHLDSVATDDLGSAEAAVRWEVAASVAVLLLVTGLGLAVRRSITQPLEEVSDGARKLSEGQLASGVTYAGRDEIGEVAAAFRDLHVTTEHLADEIRAMNVAVEANRLDRRADTAAFEGRWAELLGGMNDTMAAFAELQGRREQAERQADRIFELSQDLLCIAGFDGYFKRVNPAFERLLGYPIETLLSRPTRDFVHPDDRSARDEGHGRLRTAEDVRRFELRQLCSDGSVRRVEWSARPVPEEELIYAVGRDVTDSRHAADEQAALRRVATLVAKGAMPEEIFGAVVTEVQALFDAASACIVRFEPDGSTIMVCSTPDGSAATPEGLAAAVAGTRTATRADGAVGAPIVVQDRLWGVVAVAEGADSPSPGAEERLARFTDLVATAIANAQSRAEVAASRARVVTAGDEERRRVVRDLHDGAQQGLVHTIFTLRLASKGLDDGDEEAPALIAEALEHAERAIDELRALSHGILPAALTSGGLGTGIEALVSRMPVPVRTDVPVGRFPAVVEATAYFVVAEALTNIVKHARAAHADVTVELEDGRVRIVVRDDGVGGARSDGRGLVGVRDRLEALHGWLRIDSPMGCGTLLAAEIPLSDSPVAQGAPAPGSASSQEA